MSSVSKKYYHNIDLDQNQLIGAAIENRNTNPINPVDGQVYYHTTARKIYIYSSSGDYWYPLGNVTTVNGSIGDISITLSSLNGQPLSDNLTSLTSLTYVSPSGFVKMTGTHTFSIDSSTYINSINSNTNANQTLATGTSGTDFGISSGAGTHTFNLPDASVSARGVITTGTQTIAGDKTFNGNTNLAGTVTYFGGSQITLASNSGSQISGQTIAGTSNVLVLHKGFYNITGQTIIANAAAVVFYEYNTTTPYTTASSGTHPLVAYRYLKGLVVNANLTTPADVTNYATLYIENAASGTATITNNYSIWVDNGNVRFDSAVELPGIPAKSTETNVLYYDTTTKRVAYGTVTGGGGTTTNSLTFNTSGSGAASGSTFNGSAAVTVSYNTIGAQASSTNLTSLAGLAYGAAAFVKMTAPGTFQLDTSTYLTSAVTTLNFGTTGFTPNSATSGAITVTGTLVAANGGTGQSTYTIGDILYASASTTLSKLTAVAAGSYLRSAGTGTAPVWSTVTIPNAATLGDIWYGSATNAVSVLGGNTTATKQYLSQTGNGTISAAPVWSAISGSDITGAALTSTNDSNVTLTLGGTPTTALLRAASLTLGWTGQLAVSRGGTGLSALGTSLQVLRVNSAGTALEFATVATGGITGIGTSGNAQTGSTQVLATGTTGTDFNISSAANTHTFNIPNASTTARGLVTTGSQTFAGTKTFSDVSIGSNTFSVYSTYVGNNTSSGLLLSALQTDYRIGSLPTYTYPSSDQYAYATYLMGVALIDETATGATPLVSQLAIKPLTVNNGAGSTTNAATLYIENAATGTASITNNYAIWVDNGTVRLDGAFELQGIASATGANMLYYDTTTKRVTYGAAPTGTGSVTTVSVTSANGFAGTVATASTTPAITITTTISGILKGDGTAISAATANTDYLAVASPIFTGVLTTGTLGFTPANHFAALSTNAATYNQLITQNTNSGATASNDIVVNNNQSTDSTFYGDFGINSSTYSGSGAFNQGNTVYLTATSGDLALGTTTSNAIHFVINSGTTDAATIKTTGQLQLPGYTTTSSFSGTAAGYLAFDSSGNIITVTAPSSSGYTVTNQTTTYSVTATTGTLIVKCDTTTAGFTVTLPTAVGNTATIVIKKTVAANTLTIGTTSAQTIDGGTTAQIKQQYASITLVSDNANWQIV